MNLWRRSSRKIATYGTEPQNIHLQLQHLVEWLDANPEINGCKDLNNLQIFLKTCKYDLERTKKKIKSFYSMRAERTEWFENRDPFLPELQDILRLGVFLPIDGVDEENRKVVIIRTAAHDPKEHSQNNVFKVSKMILDLLLHLEPDNCIKGIIAIFDMTGVHLGHARQLNPRLIKRSVESWQAYPCQPKLLEFINVPTHVNLVLNTFRMFMTQKMRSRVVVKKQNSSVACAMLPKDIGGSGPSYKELSAKWRRLVEENYEFYKKHDQYKSIIKK